MTEQFNVAENLEYYRTTMAIMKDIDEQTDKLKNDYKNMDEQQKKSSLDLLTDKIKSEREKFYNQIGLLSRYDKTYYQKLWEEKLQKLNDLKNEIFPKKKFTFSSKFQKKKEQTSSTTNTSNNNNNNTPAKNDEIVINETDLVISNVENKTLKYNKNDAEVLNKNNVIISDAKNSQIYVLMNYKSFYIKNASNCKIYIGSVSGGCHITNCHDCEIFLACHQLRIHSTTNTQFYVMINSNPIIEQTHSVKFHPLKISYPDYDKNISEAKIDVHNNKWNLVQDFQWLKKDKSPNFDCEDSNEIVNLD